MSKIKVSAISYLNTKPFIHGIENHPVRDLIDLEIDQPANCAKKLIAGDVDLGIVPVDVIPTMNHHEIIGDYCIGAKGAVKTVVLFSEVPLHEIKTIVLDYQSRTSVRLCQILSAFMWEINPLFVQGHPGFETTEIKGHTAGVVIGDRVFDLEEKYPYVYDLSVEWQKHTELDFVFAAWTTNKDLPESFKTQFNEAMKIGVDSIPELTKKLEPEYPNIDLKTYYMENISYEFSTKKREGLELFWNYRKKLEIL